MQTTYGVWAMVFCVLLVWPKQQVLRFIRENFTLATDQLSFALICKFDRQIWNGAPEHLIKLYQSNFAWKLTHVMKNVHWRELISLVVFEWVFRFLWLFSEAITISGNFSPSNLDILLCKTMWSHTKNVSHYWKVYNFPVHPNNVRNWRTSTGSYEQIMFYIN